MNIRNRTIQDVTDYDAKELKVGDVPGRVSEAKIRWDLWDEIGVDDSKKEILRGLDDEDYTSMEQSGLLDLSQRYEKEARISLQGLKEFKDMPNDQKEQHATDMMKMYGDKLSKYSGIFESLQSKLFGKAMKSASNMYEYEGRNGENSQMARDRYKHRRDVLGMEEDSPLTKLIKGD